MSRLNSRIYANRNRGFTLLELLVVLVILGLLAGYVAPKYFAQVGKSEVKTARAQIEGRGIAQDTVKGLAGVQKSAEAGYAPAAAYWARVLNEGKLVPRNSHEALVYALVAKTEGVAEVAETLKTLLNQLPDEAVRVARERARKILEKSRAATEAK